MHSNHTNSQEFSPIIVIGALRSGTKLIRDSIGTHPEIDVIPHEVDHIWQTDRIDCQSDVFEVESLEETTRRKIIKKLSRFHRGAPLLIEKSVANCLRVPFVASVLPDAKFIYLKRDGADTIESIYRQWTAPADWRRLLAKVHSYPWWKDAQAFRLSTKVAARVFNRLIGREHHGAGTWGVRYEGIDDDVLSKDILEVCAIQWRQSVLSAQEGLQRIPADRKLFVQYEDFVTSPVQELGRAAEFFDIDPMPYQIGFDSANVIKSNIGSGRKRLNEKQLDIIQPHIEAVRTAADLFPKQKRVHEPFDQTPI